MRTVRDPSGQVYLLLVESSESSKVRNPETGEERYVANESLEHVSGESALETAARAIPESVRTVITAARDDRALGLLVDLAERGPLSVRELLDAYDLCESDLHALLVEFKLAGLVEETTVAGGNKSRSSDRSNGAGHSESCGSYSRRGERGYATTIKTEDALATLSSS